MSDSVVTLADGFLRRCRTSVYREIVADSLSPRPLRGGELLTRALVARRVLSRELGADERMVGVLLPPSVSAVVLNAALTLLGRTPVNLNYSLSSELIQSCIRQCGIRHVITSQRVLDKLNLTLSSPLILAEDLAKTVRRTDKIVCALQAHAVPLSLLRRWLGVAAVGPDDLATVVFTSGSTGEPKGVMLTQRNVTSNIDAIGRLIAIRPEDATMGILPFFHSFGYTVTLWAPLLLNGRAVYHVSPFDARTIGDLCRWHRVTIFPCTPTFLRNYVKRCEPDQLASVDLLILAAEKMPAELADAYEKKFGARPVEAYGATELSPLAAVNVPLHRSRTGPGASRRGSVGRAIPGCDARIVHPESFDEVPLGESGLLLIRGPNVMKGYLDRPELTASVLRDGWYVTGDIARIDGDGFIHLTGRLSRFSKIGGEMVPHGLIEECLNRCLRVDGCDDDGELRAVVTAVPDDRKGERLIVLHMRLEREVAGVLGSLSEAGLPNLWIPSADSFAEVESLPVLGSGKIDLKLVREMAVERFCR